jgi:hypothetical protein
MTMYTALLLLALQLFEPCIEWTSPIEQDLGEIASGKTIVCSFTFKNCSKEPITIANVRPSCGCTVPDWRETPIPPDSSAVIDIEFSSRKTGAFYKPIKVFFKEFPQGERLAVSGTVLAVQGDE